MKGKIILLVVFIMLISTVALPTTTTMKIKKINNVEQKTITSNDEPWTEIDKVFSNEYDYAGQFSHSVGISGDYAIIGSHYTDDMKGAAYIFKRSGDDWKQQTKLKASDGETPSESFWDWFGFSVDIDGDYAVVGSVYDDNENSPDRSPTWKAAGAAYVFKRYGNEWVEEQKLIASDGHHWGVFGYEVAIKDDYIFIGAPGTNNIHCEEGSSSYLHGPGQVYVYKRYGDYWVEEQILIPFPDGTCNMSFGAAIDVSDNYLIVGAYTYEWSRGAAYIFKREGDYWYEEEKLFPYELEEWDYYGGSVAISNDYAMVGATWDNDLEGVVYVYLRTGDNWYETQQLRDSEHGVSGGEKHWGRFGSSIDIEGNYAIIGKEFSNDWSGAAFSFHLDDGEWIEQQKIMPSDDDGEEAYFGNSVAIDGELAIIGAYRDSYGYFDDSAGSAYFFRRSNENPDAPYRPSIYGPTSGSVGEEYEFTFSSIDPNGDDLYYYIDWGDGTEDLLGPYLSDEECVFYHEWDSEEYYTIKAKAIDVFDLESEWAYHSMSVPRSKTDTNQWLNNILEKFNFPALRILSLI